MIAKIINVEKNANGNSYQIDFGNGMVLWFDTWRDDDGDLNGDWNKYIFHTNNEQDMKEKAFQDTHNDDAGAYNFSTAMETCEEYESLNK